MTDPHEWAKRAFDSSDVRREAQYQAATESANVALKALLVLNGGACLALLAFLANVIDKEAEAPGASELVKSIVGALHWFAYGAASAVLSSGLAYLVNRFYGEALGSRTFHFDYPYVRQTSASKRWEFVANALNWLAVALFFLSMGLFLYALRRLTA